MIHKQELLRLPTLNPQTEADQTRYSQTLQRANDNRLSNIPWTALLGNLAATGLSGSGTNWLQYGPRLYMLKEHSWTQLTIDYDFSSYCPTGQAPNNWWVGLTLNSIDPSDSGADFTQSAGAGGVTLGLIGLDPVNDHQSFSLTSGPISMHGDISDFPLIAGRYAIQTYIQQAGGATTQIAYNQADNFILRAYEHPPMPDVSYA